MKTLKAEFEDRSNQGKSLHPVEENQVVVKSGASGYSTEIIVGRHHVLADEPTSVGGTNRGPSPYDYLVAALGACTSITLRMYADRKKWPVEGITVRLDHQKIHASDSGTCEYTSEKIDRITREIELSGPLDDSQRRRLLEIADKCPVHRTLKSEVIVETSLRE